MELQFCDPGYVPQFEGLGCTAHQYCAAMTIDSLSSDQNHGPAGSKGTPNNADCNDFVLGGDEPINWAYITKSGQSQAPANPLYTGRLEAPNFAAVNPDLHQDLLMSPGDRIRIHLHDTLAGFRVDMFDLTTGQTGSMTASLANGFGHILYQPNSATCNEAPYAFHPEYSTANPRGNTWSVHTYNVAMSDEIDARAVHQPDHRTRQDQLLDDGVRDRPAGPRDRGRARTRRSGLHRSGSPSCRASRIVPATSPATRRSPPRTPRHFRTGTEGRR